MSDDPRRVALRDKRIEQLNDCWSRLAVEYERARRWRDRRAAAALATGLKIVDAFLQIEESGLDSDEQDALAVVRRVIREADIFGRGAIAPFDDQVEGLAPAEATEIAAIAGDPLVAAVLDKFPGAEIVGVRRRDDGAAGDQ